MTNENISDQEEMSDLTFNNRSCLPDLKEEGLCLPDQNKEVKTEDIEPHQEKTKITAAKLDLALVAYVDPNPGLFTYLQIQPSVQDSEKLHELEEIVKKS
jgi:hypothetical protein